MKRFLFCLVALIGVMVLIAPSFAAEMKINGMSRVKFISYNNMDGDDDADDQNNFIKQRMRMYFTSIASENLKLVYKNEIDFEWGDDQFSRRGTRGNGGGIGGDNVNLETKNLYMEFMVPDTPVKTTLGLQGITLHKGIWISDDAAAARFDMNFDPVSVTLAYVNAVDTDFTSSEDDVWQLHASVGYKAENMDARLSLGYEKGQDDEATTGIKSDDFYQVMGEFNMSFDMVSFFVIAGMDFGEVDGNNTLAGQAADRDYDGFMFYGGADFALDLATIRVAGMYFSGDDEGDLDKDYRSFTGETFSWSEVLSDGYFWEANSNQNQIGWIHTTNGPANCPSNMWAFNVGADLKPTDTTTIAVDLYYIGMVEDRTVAGDDEDTIGTELDVSLTQKIYDNFDVKIVGAYLLADDGYGVYNGDPDDPTVTQAENSGDDAWIIGMGFNYTF
jgi:hypothetical protein